MSFCFGSEAELENHFSEILVGRKSIICYFCFMVIFLFVILSTEQFTPKMLLVVVAAMCLIACILWMYPICLQRQREALAAADSGLRWHSEQRVYVPPNATRAQLSDVRIQLALLDRDFDYRDYDALRALDDDISSTAASTVGDEHASALPIHDDDSHHMVVDLQD